MPRDYSSEISTLLSSKHIENKTLLLALYDELIKYIEVTLGEFKFDKYYDEIITAFKSTSSFYSNAKFNNENATPKDFIIKLISLLECCKWCYDREGNFILDNFRNGLDLFINQFSFVSVLDSIPNMSLDEKVSTSFDIKDSIHEYTVTSCNRIIDFLGDEDTLDIRCNISDLLYNKVNIEFESGNYKPLCDFLTIYKRWFKLWIKEYLFKKFDQGNISLAIFEDEIVKECSKFTEYDKKILDLAGIYHICGYEKATGYENQIRMKEFCDKLNVSKTKYSFLTLGLTFRLFFFYLSLGKKLDTDEISYDDFDSFQRKLTMD